MRNVACRVLLSVALAFSLVPSAAWASAAGAAEAADDTDVYTIPDGVDYVEGEIIVGYADAEDDGYSSLSLTTLENTLDAQGIEVTSVIAEPTDTTGTVVLASVEEGTEEQAIAAAEDVAGVEYAQPNYLYSLLETDDDEADADEASADEEDASASAVPDDPAAAVSDTSVTANQYYLYGDERDEETGIRGANVIDAWDYVTCEDANVTIVVIDTGCNLTHEDLADNLLLDYCYNFYADEALEATEDFNGDYNGHGTHVCGIAAGVADNGLGIAGASYNANIIAYKVFNDLTSSPTAATSTIASAYSQLLELIDEHPELNIRVANMSLGSYGSSDTTLYNGIVSAREAGVLTVCAGGNGTGTSPYRTTMYPSDYDEVLSVTALDTDGTNAVWSDFNEYKDISAPGVRLYSTYNEDDSSYTRMSGTSMASPLVAGIVALLCAANPYATVDEIVEAITSTADEIDDSDDDYKRNSTGYGGVVSGSAGAINAAAAVLAITNATIELPDDFETLYRTQSVQLSVALEGETGEDADELEWTWSVEDGTGSATISEDGLLTGVTAGTVVVSVTATGTQTGREFTGVKTLTVAEIELDEDGQPQASVGYADAVTLSWGVAPAAVGYYVQRAASGSDEYETIATVEADDEAESYSYADATAEASKVYGYRIVPYGLLDGTVCEGAASDVASGLRFDMVTTVSSQQQAAASLAALRETLGQPVDTVVIVGESDYPTAIAAAGLAGTEDAAFLTVGDEGLDDDVLAALEELAPGTVQVVCSEGTVADGTVTAIAEALPDAAVETYEYSSPELAGEALYKLGKGSWSTTAFLVSNDAAYSDEALSVAAYAYTAGAPVFVTNASDKLSVTTRQYLMTGGFENIIVVGDTDAVTERATAQLDALSLSWQRVAGATAYETSALLASVGLASGELADDVCFFAPADLSTCLAATALCGSSAAPLLVIDEYAEDVLATVTQGSAESFTPIVYFDGADAALSDDEKDRILSYVQGDGSVEAWASTDGSLAEASVDAVAAQTYTGSAVEPGLCITYGGTQLVEGEDYTLAYADNVDVGTATAVATGIYPYSGTITASFEIEAADIADASIALDARTATYTGAAIEPDVSIAYGALELSEGTDYEIAYADNVDAGEATVTVTGTGNFAGTATASFTIACASIGDAACAAIEAQTYTARAIEPALTLTYGDAVLVEGTDYEVAYADNVEAGEASVTVTGTGNFTGTATASFTIAYTSLFPDVTDASAYYYRAAYQLAALGLMTGYTSGEHAGYFGTGDTMTRAQLVCVLWRIACPDEYAAYEAAYAASGAYSCANGSGLSDVDADRYYTAAVNWAVEAGVVTGYSSGAYAGMFRPNAAISFQDFCLVIARYAGGEAYGDGSYASVTSAQAISALAAFADGAAVSSYARSALAWCIANGLVSGYGSGSVKSLKPAQAVARERAATVVSRALDSGLLAVQ